MLWRFLSFSSTGQFQLSIAYLFAITFCKLYQPTAVSRGVIIFHIISDMVSYSMRCVCIECYFHTSPLIRIVKPFQVLHHLFTNTYSLISYWVARLLKRYLSSNLMTKHSGLCRHKL